MRRMSALQRKYFGKRKSRSETPMARRRKGSRISRIGRRMKRSVRKSGFINSAHMDDVIGGAGYALAEKLTLPFVGGFMPNVPVGLKQGIVAFGLTKLPGIFGKIGHAGLTIETYTAASQLAGNLPMLGGSNGGGVVYYG